MNKKQNNIKNQEKIIKNYLKIYKKTVMNP